MEKSGVRRLLWDNSFTECSEGVRISRHKPIRRGVSMRCTESWEGKTCGYPEVMKVGDEYRFYYRASGNSELNGESFCLAVSDDGKSFRKPKLGLFEYEGSKENNIFHREERFVDNFSVFRDENPECLPEERFKALSLISNHTDERHCTTELALYTSSDGLRFEFKRILPIKGVFDTFNVLIYDKKEALYRLYVRDFHNADGSDAEYEPTEKMESCIRDIRLSKSKDLKSFTHPERLDYGDGAPDIELYTNQIIKYPRADIFLGMPTRYKNRRQSPASFKYFGDTDGWRSALLEKGNRIGSAVTDCTVMYSYDGKRFYRDENAFVAPSYEEGRGWVYGDCYPSYNLVETVSDENPNVMEYSFYIGEGYRERAIEFIRYSIRFDGFYSMRADAEGGELLTKPLVLGDRLEINFESSALGDVTVTVCELDGKPIDGYSSGELFGNSTARRVDFEKPLSELSGREVRLRFRLRDADIYSFYTV